MNKIFNYKYQRPIRKRLRKQMPKGEILLWQRLKNSKTEYKFRRQQGIGKYVVDFYCPKLKLAIEIDGRTHDLPQQIKYDKIRQKDIEALGIKVKRFYSDDIFNDLDYVVDSIKNVCDDLSRLSANI